MDIIKPYVSMWLEKNAAEAARSGNLDDLIIEINKGVILTEWTSAMAMESNNMVLIQWLIDSRNIIWSPWCCSTAALHGYLDLLIICRAHNCPWDAETCSHAARNNHFEILKYARDNGCVWNSDTFNYARHYHGNSQMFQWICDNNCPTDKNDSGNKCTCKQCL